MSKCNRSGKSLIKIGELSRLTGVTVITLRYYENEGLIESSRAESKYRLFSEEMVKRVQQLKRYRALNLGIQEMKRLLEWDRQPQEYCLETSRLIEKHLQHVVQRKEILTDLEAELRRLLQSCRNTQGNTCEILRELSGPDESV
jgi:DNA-binding transcriptional MerR regulator